MGSAERHGHPAVLAANDLWAIAAKWPELKAAAARGEGAGGEKVKGSKSAPIPINAAVVDVISEVDQWAVFLARTLMDEVLVHTIIDTTTVPFVHTQIDRYDPWAPASTRTEKILEQIAAERVGHFTHHEDEMLALAFIDDASRLRRLVEHAAQPSGRRTLQIGARCFEHGTSDMGARIPCPGQYTVLADPEKPYVIPDVICDEDRTHRIDPTEWQRAYRRRGDAQGAVDLISTWRPDGSMSA